MQSDANQVPSVACLLYLAADELVPRGVSGIMLKATKIPCRPVWVQPIKFQARDRLVEPVGLQKGASPIPLSATWSGPNCSTLATTPGPIGSASSRIANGSPPWTRPPPPPCAGGDNGKPPSPGCALPGCRLYPRVHS
jgi:hypothetical protein